MILYLKRLNVISVDFVDGCDKREELLCWTSSNGTASWKLLSFNETKQLSKQILQQQEIQETQGTKPDPIRNGDFYF